MSFPPVLDGRLAAVHGPLLLGIAADSIRHGLAHGRPLPAARTGYPPAVLERRPLFVTLERRGVLHGCVGRLDNPRPLVREVAANAFAAAFRDGRFAPLTAPELEGLTITISLLDPPQPIRFRSEEDLLDQLVPGRDGLIIQTHWTRAVFLPAVWNDLPDPADFLRHLKAKAGLPSRGLPPDLEASRFQVQCICGDMK
jgi:hypothetical protein